MFNEGKVNPIFESVWSEFLSAPIFYGAGVTSVLLCMLALCTFLASLFSTSANRPVCQCNVSTRFQSPINIITRSVQTMYLNEPLCWSGFDQLPFKMSLLNSQGICITHYHTSNDLIYIRIYYIVTLLATFGPQCGRPCIRGGGLGSTVFVFDSIRFRCQSEHKINSKTFPLELQVGMN